MWGKLTSLASVVTGQDDEEYEWTQQASSSKDIKGNKGADDNEIQLVEQQKLIMQLKEMIRDREKNLVEKENELKKVSADFSKLKLQSKSKIVSLSKQMQESQRIASDAVEKASVDSDESMSTTTVSDISSTVSEKKWKAKLTVARKQLQSNEKLIQELNSQLDRKNSEVEAKERVLAEKEEEQRRMSTQLKGEISKSKIEGRGDDETKKQLQTRLEEMIIQLAYKDNKILELVNQISEREGGAIDLRELVNEKDEVIKGRDQAIVLLRMSLKERDQREAGLIATIDRMKWKQDDLEEEVQRLKAEIKISNESSKGEKELEEVTEMREKFLALLAEEKANSSSTVEKMKLTCDMKCQDLDGQLLEYGVSRDALLSRVEELEGLLESMTQEKDELQKRLKFTEEAETKEGSEGNKFSKFKALAGSKIKALEKEVEQLREQSTELTQLRNRVTELEEEKGNLQLQMFENEEKLSKKDLILMQLDEMRQQCEDFLLEINNLRDKNSALEGITKQQENTISQLKKMESEKELALIRAEELEATIRCLEARFESLRKQLEERTESASGMEKENSVLKSSGDLLERKIKHFEDEIARLRETNEQLKGSMESTDCELFVYQKNLDDLRIENKSLRGQIAPLQTMEMEFKCVKEELKSKVCELEEAQRSLKEKNKLLEDASIRLIDVAENSSMLSQEMEFKNTKFHEMEDKIKKLLIENENKMEDIKSLLNSNNELEEKLSNLKSLPLSIEGYPVGSVPSTEHVKQEAPLKNVIMLPVEKSGAEQKSEEVETLKDLLKQQEEKFKSNYDILKTELEELKIASKEKDCLLDELKLDNERLILQTSENEKFHAELQEHRALIEILKSQKSVMENQDAELKTLLSGKDEMIQSLLSDIELSSRKLVEVEAALSDLKHNYDSAIENSSALEKTLILTQDDLSKTKMEIEQLNKQLVIISKDKDEQMKISFEKQQELDVLLEEFDATVLKLKESHNDKHTAEHEIKKLETQLYDLMKQCDSLKNENDAYCHSIVADSEILKQNLAKATEENQDLKSHSLQLENLKEKLTAEIIKKDETLLNISRDLEAIKKENQECKKNIVGKDSELDVLRIISKEAQSNSAASSSDLQSCREDVENLKRTLYEMETKLESKDRDISNLSLERVEHEKIQASSKDSKLVEAKDELFQQLSNELNKSRMEAAELRESLKHLEKKSLEKDKKIESLSEILEEEESQLISTKEEVEKLKKSSQTIVTDLKIKDEEAAKLAETLKEKEVVIKKYLIIMKKQKDSLKQAKEDLNQSLNSEDDKMKKLQEKIVILESVVSGLEIELKSARSNCELQKFVLERLSKLLDTQGFNNIEEKVQQLLDSKSSVGEVNKEILQSIASEIKSLKDTIERALKECSMDYEKELELHETAEKILKAELKNNIAGLNDTLNKKEDNLNSMILEKDHLLKEVDRMSNQSCLLEESLKSVKSEVEVMKREHEEEREKLLKDREEKIKAVEALRQIEVDSLNSSLESSQKSLNNFKKEVEVMTEKISELKKIHESNAEHFIRTKHESEVQNLKLVSQISDISSLKTSLEEQVTELLVKSNSDSEISNFLMQENQLLKDQIQNLELAMKCLGSEKTKEEQELEQLKSFIESLKSELSTKVTENDELKASQKNLLEQMKGLQLESTEVKKRFEELNNQSEVIIKEKESFQVTMKVEMEKLRQSSEHDHQTKLVRLHEDLESVENLKQGLQDEVESLKTKLSEKNKHSDNISKQLQGEMKKLEILEIEFEELRLENQQMTETIGDLKKRLHDSKKFNQEAIKIRDDLTKNVERLTREVSEKEKMAKLMEDSMKKSLSESEAKILELNKKIVILGNDNIAASEVLEMSKHQQASQSDKVDDLMKKIGSLEDELVKSKERSDAELNNLRGQFDLLSNDVASYQHLISKLENNKRHLEAQMNDVKPMMGKLKEELKRQESDKLRLRQSLSLLEADKGDLMVEIDRLRQRVKMAEDLEDDLELDYKQEVEIYKEKLKEMQDALERSQKSEEELNQVNDKLLHHNNALIKNTEELFDQLSQYKDRETVAMATTKTPSPPPLSDHHLFLQTTLSTVTKERDLLKEEISDLRLEVQTLRFDLKSAQASSEAIQISTTAVHPTEFINHERLQGSSLPPIVPPKQEDVDLPGIHSGWPHHSGSSPAAGDFDYDAVKSQVNSLTLENSNLVERLKESERMFVEKERELSEFYQQYQLLYQQYTALQQPLVQKDKGSVHNMDGSFTIPYEKYQDLESLNRQLMDEHRHLERQLQAEQERRSEVEEGFKVVRNQYEQHRLLLDGASSNENHSIPMFSNEEEERRILPQNAPLYVQLRHRCLQLKRIMTRADHNKLNLGTIYRYRSHLWKFFIFYFIFIHLLFLFRC